MYLEELLPTIKRTGNKELIQKFYLENLGLMHRMMRGMYTGIRDEDDMLQLAYFALKEAIRVYRIDSEFSFTAYFRRCFVHLIFQHNLKFRYPFRITWAQLQEIKDGSVEFNIVSMDSISDSDLHTVDDAFLDLEQKMLRFRMKQLLKQLLTAVEYRTVVCIYYKQLTKKVTALSLGLTYNQIRGIEHSALRKLRRSNDIRDLAKNYFGIRV